MGLTRGTGILGIKGFGFELAGDLIDNDIDYEVLDQDGEYATLRVSDQYRAFNLYADRLYGIQCGVNRFNEELLEGEPPIGFDEMAEILGCEIGEIPNILLESVA